MTPRDIALLALATQDAHTPDETITRWLHGRGITGDMTDPRFREAWSSRGRRAAPAATVLGASKDDEYFCPDCRRKIAEVASDG